MASQINEYKSSLPCTYNTLSSSMPSPGETTSCESNNTFRVVVLPLDLITQVLVRLPVKVVVRFKIVCKFWYSLVSTMEFAKLHQQQQQQQQQQAIDNNPSLQILMVGHPPDQRKLKNINLTTRKAIDNNPSLQTLKIEASEMDKLYKATGCWIYNSVNSVDKLKHKFDHPESYPIGSCNGLVCFIVGLRHKMRLCLWNPATDEYHYIKMPHLSQGSVPLCWGFGYDPLSQDYKILVLLGELMPIRKPSALLFRLSDTSNTWSRVECPSDHDMSEFMVKRTEEDSKDFRSLPILVGHTLYWKTEDIKKLLAFDLATDSFQIVPLPTPEPTATTIDFYICKLRQCLCACWLCIDPSCSSKYIKVLMLDDGGNDKVWKSMFKFRGVERLFGRSNLFPKLFELKEDHKYLLLESSSFKLGLLVDSRGEFHHPSKGVMLTSGYVGYYPACYVFDYTPTLACPSPHLATTIT